MPEVARESVVECLHLSGLRAFCGALRVRARISVSGNPRQVMDHRGQAAASVNSAGAKPLHESEHYPG